MHQDNPHKNGYDFSLLEKENPSLAIYIQKSKKGKTIDFTNNKAIIALNKALLNSHYGISFWEFNASNLCPPIPSRIEYLLQINDFLKQQGSKAPFDVLDIGTGATCIYPILGNKLLQWRFVGVDCNNKSMVSANTIIQKNKLKSSISLRLQKDKKHILKNVILPKDAFTISICNPPFYRSKDEAVYNNEQKWKKLQKEIGTGRNFSGIADELWYPGGEKAFLHNYLYESSIYKEQFQWFSSLISKKENVKSMLASFKKMQVKEQHQIPIRIGNKQMRILCWKF